jgi:uncharacterized protein (DUF427 family)
LTPDRFGWGQRVGATLLAVYRQAKRPEAVSMNIIARRAPYPAVAAIAGHLAFYPDRVDAFEEHVTA